MEKQPVPTRMQIAYRHLVNEYKVLQQQDESFRENIIALKMEGTKNEPAFAQLPGLQGDPYAAMLQLG